MIVYTTGDLLQSTAQALVNTVNCEGYMGKGIAYQFKLQYPENNVDYIKACKTGKLTVGKLHYFSERGKIIINFPTKNKWRENSKIEYIQEGLDELITLISKLDIKSIAIPPLGSGNGGLNWMEVKKLIEEKLCHLPNQIEIMIYEPSSNYVSKPVLEPKLSTSALILMAIKKQLSKFDTLRLQKTAYFVNYFSGQSYFNFQRHKYGPYDNAISIISKNIKAFQKFHNVSNTEEAYRILHNRIVSDHVENKLNALLPYINMATDFVNGIQSNHELECISTVLFLVSESNGLSDSDIITQFKLWSDDKANRYSESDILNAISKLLENNMIQSTLVGYSVRLTKM